MSNFGVIRDAMSGLTAGVAARAQTPAGNALQVQVGPGDVISNIPVVIEYDHHQVHEGEVWQWWWFGTLNSATKDVRISVPTLTATTRTPHLLPEIISDATTTQGFLYEAVTWTASGTDDSSRIFNRNRNIGGSPNTKIYVSGGTALTVNSTGTQIWQGYLFSGKSALTVDRASSEWDLKSNTEYLFRVTTTGNGSVLMRLNFYEDLGV